MDDELDDFDEEGYTGVSSNYSIYHKAVFPKYDEPVEDVDDPDAFLADRRATLTRKTSPEGWAESVEIAEKLGIDPKEVVGSLQLYRDAIKKYDVHKQRVSEVSPNLSHLLNTDDAALGANADRISVLSDIESSFQSMSSFIGDSWDSGRLSGQKMLLLAKEYGVVFRENLSEDESVLQKDIDILLPVLQERIEQEKRLPVQMLGGTVTLIAQQYSQVVDWYARNALTRQNRRDKSVVPYSDIDTSFDERVGITQDTINYFLGGGLFLQNARSLYGDAISVPVDQGVKPSNEMLWTALGASTLNMAMETGVLFVGGILIFKGLSQKIGASISAKISKPAVKKIMENKTASLVAGGVAAWHLGSVSEGLQAVNNELAFRFGSYLSDDETKNVVSSLNKNDLAEVFAEEFVAAYKSLFLLAAAGVSSNVIVSQVRLKKQKDNNENLKQATEKAAKLAQEQSGMQSENWGGGNQKQTDDSSEFQSKSVANIIDKIIPNDVRDLFVDRAVLNDALNQLGMSRDELRKILPDVIRQLDEAVLNSDDAPIELGMSDIKLTASNALIVLNGTKLGDLLAGHIRVGADGLSDADIKMYEEETRQYIANIDVAEKEQVKKQQAKQRKIEVEKQIKESNKTEIKQLMATGAYSKTSAAYMVSMKSAFVKVISQDLGVMPSQFDEWFPHTIGKVDAVDPSVFTSFGVDKDSAVSALVSIASFNPETLTTSLTKDATLTSYLHELSHYFLEVYSRIAESSKSEKISANMQQILSWFGVSNINAWRNMSVEQRRKYDEQWAYNFEKMLSGNAPSTNLSPAFRRFGAWLRSVYRGVDGVYGTDDDVASGIDNLYKNEIGDTLPDLPLNVRAVMDSFLASEAAIVSSQNIFNNVGLFKTQEQAGMTDAEWSSYQLVVVDAYDNAIIKFTNNKLRQLRFYQKVRGRIAKDIDKTTELYRESLREDATGEVKSRPLYMAIDFFKTGINADGSIETNHKLSLKQIEKIYKRKEGAVANVDDNLAKKGNIVKRLKDRLGTGKYGMLGNKYTIDINDAVDKFGFKDVHDMFLQLFNAKPVDVVISNRMDARYRELYSGKLSKQEIEDAITAATHNDVTNKLAAFEVSFLDGSVKSIGILKSAKQVAMFRISNMPLSEILDFNDSRAAENFHIEKARYNLRNGFHGDALKHRQLALVETVMVGEVAKARQQIAARLANHKKFEKPSYKLAYAGINIDYIMIGREILFSAGVIEKGNIVEDARASRESLRSADVKAYEDVVFYVAANFGELNKHYKAMTFDEFTAFSDIVDGLMSRKIEQDKTYEEKILPMLKQLALTRNAEIGDANAKTTTSNDGRGLRQYLTNERRGWLGLIARFEHYIDYIDGDGNLFAKHLSSGIYDGLDKYKVAALYFKQKLAAIFESIDLRPDNLPKVFDTEDIFGIKLGESFFASAKEEVLGIMLHLGNESNTRKLLESRGWTTLDNDGNVDLTLIDQFVKRAIEHGYLTKTDMDAVQKVWDLNEEIKPLTQAAHKSINGFYYEEIKPQPIALSFNGEKVVYKGGYIPIKRDFIESPITGAQAEANEIQTQFLELVTPINAKDSFTKERTYSGNSPVSMRGLAENLSHIDETLRYAYLQHEIMKVLLIVNDAHFSKELERHHPRVIESVIKPFLGRAARQSNTKPSKHHLSGQAIAYVTKMTGLSLMFSNIANASQQILGLVTALVDIKPKYLFDSSSEYFKSVASNKGDSAFLEHIGDMSPFMKERFGNTLRNIQRRVKLSLKDIDNNHFKSPKAFYYWVQDNGYFLQAIVQNKIDAVVWMANFEQYMATKGVASTVADIENAIRDSDSKVRMTLESFNAEDKPELFNASRETKALQQFSSWFNTVANVFIFRSAKSLQKHGLNEKAAMEIALIGLLSMIAPFIVGDLIASLFRGGEDDKDEDEDDSGDYGKLAIDSLVNGMARGFFAHYGTLFTEIYSIFSNDNKPYTGSRSAPPAWSMGVSSVRSLEKALKDKFGEDGDGEVKGRDVRNMGYLLSVFTGFPAFYYAGKSAGYMKDVSEERVSPTSKVDYIRGVTTGSASPKSKE